MGKTARRLLPLLVLLCALTGCQAGPKTAQTTIFAMDTVMDLQIYGSNESACRTALDRCVEEIYALDRQLSAENPDSFVYALNHAGGAWAEVPDAPALALFMDTLALCEKTGGALDVTAYPATLAWGFISGDYRVPDAAELEALAGRIDYSAVGTSNWEGPSRRGGVRLPEGMALDLGAVAKGYAADRLNGLLEDSGCGGALLDLGQSTILAAGGKPDGSPWRIGILDPEGEENRYLGVLEVRDRIIATSGGYQRYFEENGQTYWHILDPDTAAPARSGLASVTVVGKDGLTCDGLSTALFVMGLEEGTGFWRNRAANGLEFDVIFISDDGSIAVTAGLEDSFTLAQGYEDREVTVLR